MRPDRSSWMLRSLNVRVLFALALLLPACASAVTSTDYAYRFALETKGSSAAWRVELTPAVYAASRRDADLRDLVVINAQGREVPFAVLPPAPPQAHPYAVKAHLLPLPANAASNPDGVRVQRNANGDIAIELPQGAIAAAKPTQWLLDAKREVSLDSIAFDPSALAQDLRIHLSVDASNDLKQWDNRNVDTEIVSVKRGEDAVEQGRIGLVGAPARYYRLSLIDGDAPWDAAQTPAVDLSGSFTDAVADRAASRQWQTLQAHATTPSPSGGTNYDYRLAAALPLEAARVALADANTVARFVLTTHDSDYAAASLATITAVQTGTAAENAKVSTFEPVRVQHLRLHTETPLAQAPTLAVGWHPDVFVFLAAGAGPYSLLAGSYTARRGDYPVDAALEKMRAAATDSGWQPPLATLDARSDAGGAGALLAPTVPYDWTKPLLWIVLAGGALLVAWMALSLLRQSRRDDTTG